MREMIDCFLPDFDRQAMAATVSQLEESKAVRTIFWSQPIASSASVMYIAEQARAPYVLLFTKPATVVLGQGAVERMLTAPAIPPSTTSQGLYATTSTSVRCGSCPPVCFTPLPCRPAKTTTSTPVFTPCASF